MSLFCFDQHVQHAAGAPRGMGAVLPLALLLLTAMLALPCGPAAADVFMWKDPATGKTRMTNIAPPWLREPKPGVRIPKVEVIRGGKVLDPAAAFATPDAQPVSTRRREGDENRSAGSAATGRPAAQATGAAPAAASPFALPSTLQLPPGFQVPLGTMLVPIEAPPPEAPAGASR